MALLETIILYCQITLGIANPTSTDIQAASAVVAPDANYTYVTSSPTSSSNTISTWDIHEGN